MTVNKMIENENEVIKEVSIYLAEYDIKSDMDFQDYLSEVIDYIVDIFYDDLFNSVKFLYLNEYLESVEGDFIEVLQRAQYDYYMDIVYDNLESIYELSNITYLKD